MDAADKLDTLVNLHFVTSTTDESEQERTSGISTEVWADLDSKKWVAVYSSIDGDNVTIYQSQMRRSRQNFCWIVQSRPAIVTENDEKTLGDVEEHVAITTREVVSYNSEEATTTLHEYLNQIKE